MGSPEGQMSPGRLDVLQEGNPKSTGTDCPHVPKDKTLEKKAGLPEEGAWLELGGKNRGYDL